MFLSFLYFLCLITIFVPIFFLYQRIGLSFLNHTVKVIPPLDFVLHESFVSHLI